MLPDDLKEFRSPQGWNLLTPDQALVAILIALALAVILDRFGVWK